MAKIEIIKYKETWCDYLTPCPYIENIDCGDYDCYNCKYNKGMTHNFDNSKIEGYGKYMVSSDETVKCTYKSEHEK